MREISNKSPMRVMYNAELENDNFSIFLIKSEETLEHSHKFFELAYIKKGPIKHSFNGKEQILNNGDYFIVDYGVRHGYVGTDIAVINCLFRPELIDRTLVNCSGFDDVLNNYLIKYYHKGAKVDPEKRVYHDFDGSIYTILNKMADEYRDKKNGYMELIRCYMIEIIIKTMRTTTINLAYDETSGIVKYISQYVELNYAKPLTLGKICKNLSYSLPYVSKKFKEETGESFMEYLQRIRIEEACRLLYNTKATVDKISQMVGYSDVKYFRKIFRDVLNITPNRYRKQLLKDRF